MLGPSETMQTPALFMGFAANDSEEQWFPSSLKRHLIRRIHFYPAHRGSNCGGYGMPLKSLGIGKAKREPRSYGAWPGTGGGVTPEIPWLHFPLLWGKPDKWISGPSTPLPFLVGRRVLLWFRSEHCVPLSAQAITAFAPGLHGACSRLTFV